MLIPLCTSKISLAIYGLVFGTSIGICPWNSYRCKQVTRGHNIVADGWAGASNHHPHPNPLPTLKHTQKVSKTLVFALFNWITMTDQRTDGRTDKGSYGVACPQLKMILECEQKFVMNKSQFTLNIANSSGCTFPFLFVICSVVFQYSKY